MQVPHSPRRLGVRRLSALGLSMALLLPFTGQAQPWPRELRPGQGYGRCPDFYQPLPLALATQPPLRQALNAITQVDTLYGLADGKYLADKSGGHFISAPAHTVNKLPRNLCIGTKAELLADAQPETPHPNRHGILYYTEVQIDALERIDGKGCARFSRRGVPVAAGCLNDVFSSPLMDRMLQAFRLGSILRVGLDSRHPISVFPTASVPAYTIVTLDH